MMATCSPQTKDIDKLVDVYIQNAEDLITQCQQLELKDAKKLEKKCRSELKYLQSLKERRKTVQDYDIKIQEHDLKSSNLSHFAAILHAVHNLPNVKKILRPFSCTTRQENLVVDVVAEDGHVWVKVIARKAQALHLIWAGKGQYGDRDIVRQAEDYMTSSTEHPINFTVPEVHYAFYNEVTEPMAIALESIGIKVWGKRTPVSADVLSLIDTNDTISDDELPGQKKSTDSDTCDEDFDDDGEFHIPTASEFTSGLHKQNKDLQNLHISEKSKQYLENDCEVKNSKNNEHSSTLDIDNHSSNPHKHVSKPSSTSVENSNCISDGFDSKQSKIKREEMKHISEPSFTSVTTQEENSKQSKIKREEMFSSVLGSAPVYCFQNKSKTSDVNIVQSDCDSDIKRVNLDITTMITLVSSITHGGSKFVFNEKILNLQAQEERESPVLPELHNYLKDKQMYVCQTAVDDFQNILSTLGGENETLRAKELLDKCEIVPDQPSLRSKNLPQTGKIRERSKTIFGTGDQLKCVTVSANSGFVRAAEHQGTAFSVYLHASRALTEKKEQFAEPLTET